MTQNIADSFDPVRAVQLCGLRTVAMLDYLERTEVFIPSLKREKRRGKERRYTFRDILTLKAIKKLLDSGASVAALKRSLTEFQKRKWFADPGNLRHRDEILRYLVISQDKVYLRRNAEILVELSHSGQLTFSFIIDLDNLHSELKKDLGYKVIEEPQFPLVNGE